jgi:hypothetical protein
VLTNIAAEIRKLEIGEEGIKERRPSFGAPNPDESLPHGPKKALTPWGEEFAQLDIVDRNLVRAAAQTVVDIIMADVRESRLGADVVPVGSPDCNHRSVSDGDR